MDNDSKAKPVPISMDGTTRQILENLCLMLKKGKSEVVQQALGYYYEYVTEKYSNKVN